jgi:hypothetical protein
MHLLFHFHIQKSASIILVTLSIRIPFGLIIIIASASDFREPQKATKGKATNHLVPKADER